MGEHNLQFAALVGSRICHDLISPIGAINNGMELLSMSGLPPSPEMALIAQSVDAANARLRFFRIAYGAPNDAQLLGQSEITSILRDITEDSRLSLHWKSTENHTRSEVQLVFLAIQCAEQALPYGGEIAIHFENARWRLELNAERFTLDPVLWSTLEISGTAETDIIPAHVQFLLLPLYAAEKSRKVQVIQSETKITLIV